jgi:hypothetical protein
VLQYVLWDDLLIALIPSVPYQNPALLTAEGMVTN